MNPPLVSIVIPAYKPEHFEQCLRSAIGQTYSSVEIIVSDDSPGERIREICRQFPTVTYQRSRQTGTMNVVSTLFEGTGDYIKPLFDDDLLHPFCVERMVAAMAQRPEIELVFSASRVIDVNNQRLEERQPYERNGMLHWRTLYNTLALTVNVVGEASSIMFKRQRLSQLGPEKAWQLDGHNFLHGLGDVALYCNLARGGLAYYIDEELSYFRRDPRLGSNSNPANNPNYGLLLSEGIDLVLAAHREQVVSDEELRGCRDGIDNLRVQWGTLYPQHVLPAYQRYIDCVAGLPAR